MQPTQHPLTIQFVDNGFNSISAIVNMPASQVGSTCTTISAMLSTCLDTHSQVQAQMEWITIRLLG